MPTATTTSPESEIKPVQEIPAKLWALYRQRRLVHDDKPRAACREALDEHKGFTSQRNREQLADLLVEREQQRGLASTDAEYEVEVAAQAAAAEAAEAAAVAQEAKRGLPELEDEWHRHQARAAIGDPDAIAAIKVIESEMKTAKDEQDRQDQQAQGVAKAERERREGENAAGAELEPAVAKQKIVADRAFASAAVEARKLQELQDRQCAHLVAGGLDTFSARGVRFDPGAVESAIRFAFQGSELGLFRGVSGRDHPLVPEQEGQ
jgi:hypothetical protein